MGVKALAAATWEGSHMNRATLRSVEQPTTGMVASGGMEEEINKSDLD